MSRMYYRGAKAAVVCYDVTDARTWEKVKFWVEELKKNESECRIYIVGTKIDLLVGCVLNNCHQFLSIVAGIKQQNANGFLKVL